MEANESVYLYAKDQIALYENVLEQLEDKKCPQTHTVYALLDVEESEIPTHMANHVASCKECQKTVLLSQAVNGRINQLIPDFAKETPDSLSNQNKNMFQKSEFSLPSRTKIRLKELAEITGENVIDIFSVIFSAKMGVAYVAAVFLALFLNWAV